MDYIILLTGLSDSGAATGMISARDTLEVTLIDSAITRQVKFLVPRD
jgi:hypothetical protein